MSKHIIIVGAGVVGLATAYHCAKEGHKVTVLERGPEADGGCSFGNAGMIVPSHFIPLAAPGMVALGLKWMWDPESPFYIKPRLDKDLVLWGLRFWSAATRERVAAAEPVLRDISLFSRASYLDLEAQGLDLGLVQNGLLMLCKSEHTLDEEAKVAARARELGIPAEVLDAKGAAAKDPAVTMDVAGGVFFPKDAHLPPERLMKALLAACRAMGVAIEWNTPVSGWKHEGTRLRAAETAGGTREAEEFVLCAGVWSDGMARALDLNLPMQAGKGYSVTLPNPRQLPALCSILTEARVAVTPMDGALRVGGTMEVAGIQEGVNPRRVRGILRAIPRYFPEFRENDFEGITPWHGLRPCSPDGMPYIGRTRRWGNLVCCTGHAMMGLSLAPASGRIAADLVSGRQPPVPLDLFSPDRYSSRS